MKKYFVVILACSLSLIMLTGCSSDNTTTSDTIEPTKTFSHSTTSDQYQPYTEKLMQEWLSEWKQVILFFAADRCPLCRKLDANLAENKEAIPDNLLILTLDYDSEEVLKKEYWISSQHTLVYLDSTWEILLSNIKKEVTLQDVVDVIETL